MRGIREVAAAGDIEAKTWLEQHANLIAAVEACQKIRNEEALRSSAMV